MVAAKSAVADVVRQYWGFDTLRPLQQDAIDAALAGRDSLVVMPTGGGKSLCYQVPPAVSGGTGNFGLITVTVTSSSGDSVTLCHLVSNVSLAH